MSVILRQINEKADVMVNLYENKISLVPKNVHTEISNEDTYDKNISFLNKIKEMNKHLGFVIATTTRCNLNCTYCYEKSNSLEYADLKSSSVNNIVDFIMKTTLDCNPKFLTTVFTGGEPLLNVNSIVETSEMLNDRLKNFGVEYKFTIVTNGTIKIEDRTLNVLLTNGLNGVQVSIDGEENIHNARRRSNFNSYRKTLDNIDYYTSKGISTIVRVNIDNENIGSLKKLLEELSSLEYSNRILLSFYPTEKPRCELSECDVKYDFDKISLIETAKREAKALDLKVGNKINLQRKCLTNTKYNAVFGAKGEVYKCGGMIGRYENALGYVEEQDIFHKIACNDYSNIKEYCKECDIMPFCMGGCKYNSNDNNKCDLYSLKLTELKSLVGNILSQNEK